MNEKIIKIKKSESPPKVIKNLFNQNEIRDFLDLSGEGKLQTTEICGL